MNTEKMAPPSKELTTEKDEIAAELDTEKMEPPSKEVTTEKDKIAADLDIVISKIKEKIKELQDVCPEENKEKTFNACSSIKDELHIARSEFDAIKFFIVSFGILKSGKSTLVNLLAGREDISPTKLGRDTTLRPCIIIKGEQDSLHTFDSSTTAGNEGRQKAFNQTLDYLRGSMSEADLDKSDVKAKAWPFHKIEHVLCSPTETLGKEPLITVITLKECSELLSNDVAVLDLPGLDSEALRNESERILKILERSDLLLFIQSTIAALNKDALDVLKHMESSPKQSPVFLIQNQFDAQPWKNTDDLIAKDNELSKYSKTLIAKYLGKDAKDIESFRTNLGKAYDATFKTLVLKDDVKPSDLLEDSQYKRFIEEVTSVLKKDRMRIQLKGCSLQLENSVTNGLKSLSDLKDEVNSANDEVFKLEKECDDLYENLKKEISYTSPKSVDELDSFIKHKETKLSLEIESYVEHKTTKLPSEDAKRSDLSDDFEKMKDHITATLPKQVFKIDDSDIRELDRVFQKDLCPSKSNVESTLQELKDYLRFNKAGRFCGDLPCIEAKAMVFTPDIYRCHIQLAEGEARRSILTLGIKKHYYLSPKSVKDDYIKLAKESTVIASAAGNQLKLKYPDFFDRYEKFILEQFNERYKEVRKSLNEKSKSNRKKYEQQFAIIDELEDFFKELSQCALNVNKI